MQDLNKLTPEQNPECDLSIIARPKEIYKKTSITNIRNYIVRLDKISNYVKP